MVQHARSALSKRATVGSSQTFIKLGISFENSGSRQEENAMRHLSPHVQKLDLIPNYSERNKR